MRNHKGPAPVAQIAQSILVLRGRRVLLDADLAVLYGVTTTRLNQQVRRNPERFPADFMFALSATEYSALKLQIATSKRHRGGRRKVPLVFTEHGAIMAATILKSPRAVEMSIYVVRAFARLRRFAGSHRLLAKRLDDLETEIARRLGACDQAIAGILTTLRQLAAPPSPKRRSIGFTADI